MELQPGEEARPTIVQPAAPQVVFDTTKKEKRPITEKQRAQLDAARKSRIEKRKLEKEALARESAANTPTQATSSSSGSGGSGSDRGQTTGANGHGLVTDPAGANTSVPVQGEGAAPATSAAVESTDLPPSKRHRADSSSIDSSSHSAVDSSSGTTAGNGSANASVTSSDKVYREQDLSHITDPMVRDIRMGKRKPILWSCEGLDALREYKPPKST